MFKSHFVGVGVAGSDENGVKGRLVKRYWRRCVLLKLVVFFLSSQVAYVFLSSFFGKFSEKNTRCQDLDTLKKTHQIF